VQSNLGRRLGAFRAKNLYQVLRLSGLKGIPGLARGRRSSAGINEARTRIPYSETGPGSRSFVNVLAGWPKVMNISRPGSSWALFYSFALHKLHLCWRRQCKNLLSDLPEALHEHLHFFRT
jgi:hypothetical protein